MNFGRPAQVGIGIALLAFAGLTFTSGQFVPSPGPSGGGGATSFNGSAACPAGSGMTSISLAGSGSAVAGCAGFAASGTPSVTITHPTFAGPINLSTLGNIDWWDCGAQTMPNGNPPFTVSNTNVHFKFGAGYIWESVAGIGHLQTYTSASDQTFTSTAADDSTQSALSSAVYCDQFNTTSGIGYGIRLHVPAVTTGTRVLRIYWATGAGCTTTVTATLNVSGTTASDSFSGASNFVETITYGGGSPADVLQVTSMITANSGTCGIGFYAVSLGTV